MRISDCLQRYLVQLQGDGRAKPTIDQARRHIRLLISFVGDIEIADVGHETIAAFLASNVVRTRAGGGLRKPSSANALRSSIRCFFAFVHMAAYAPSNASRMVRRARSHPPRQRALSEGDTTKLVAAFATATTPAEKRDHALFVTMLKTGLRVGSAVGLDIEDIDLAAGELNIRTLKNGGADTVFMPADLVALLRSYVSERTTGPLFAAASGERMSVRQVGRRLESWSERAGIGRRVNPHSLRHSFALAAYERTGDVLMVSRLLLHRSLASTSVYARPTESRVRAAMAAH
jgi:site-specific recombinase XerD